MGYKDLKFEEGSVFLVTGGAGFIGCNLCEAILTMGYEVRCLDDLSTGKQENIDFLFSNDKNYKKGLPTPEIYCLAVDKRNQMHIGERHMVSEYMLIYFIHKYVSDNQIDLESMWKEINGLQTKVEYIAVSNDYYEINVGDEVVLVEQDDLYWR